MSLKPESKFPKQGSRPGYRRFAALSSAAGVDTIETLALTQLYTLFPFR